jgi:hypothetical protein
MSVARGGLLSVVLMTLNACPAPTNALGVVPLTVLFGPAISREPVRGRQDDGDGVMVLVEGAIVRLHLGERRVERVTMGVAPGESCWGLAKLADGSLWTLKGRNAVVRIEPDGRVSRTIPLKHPHTGLMASGDRLIYQRALPAAPEPALRAGLPGDEEGVPWSSVLTRSFPGLARVQAAALSMVTCGATATEERPCWFPDEAAVALIAADGRTRRIALAGLSVVAPEVLLTAENPRRPVRDAYVDRDGRIWVLSTGDAPPGAPDLPGGWLLARYAADGAPDGQVRLAEPARLILRTDGRRVIVLAGSGHVSEITPW